MSIISSYSNAYFEVLVPTATVYGRKTYAGAPSPTKYYCRYAKTRDLEAGINAGSHETITILCDATAEIGADDRIHLYNKVGTSLGYYQITSMEKGEFLTAGKDVMRLIGVKETTV